MPPLARPRVFESRVARRLFGHFVASALLPLALAGALASSTVAELTATLQEKSQADATHQTSLQIFDRLLAAKRVLTALPASPGAGSTTAPLRGLAEPMFARLVGFAADGSAFAIVGAVGDLDRAWSAVRQADGGVATTAADASSDDRVLLRVLPGAGGESGAPRLMLARLDGDRNARWVGELKHAHVFAPLANSAINSGWLVSDGRRQVIAREGEADLVPPADAGATNGKLRVHRAKLFLAGEFGSGLWELAEGRAAPEALWHGASLGLWLVGVGVATVLIVALVSLRQIRRTLVPLSLLGDGTRRVAAGAARTRVEIRGGDEFADLGRSFNEMATRIEDQLGSLEELARIDRDVLGGTAIESVVAHVVERLGTSCPQVSVTAWWSGRPAGELCGLHRRRGAERALESRTTALDAASAARLAALHGDEWLARPTDATGFAPAVVALPGTPEKIAIATKVAQGVVAMRGRPEKIAAAAEQSPLVRSLERMATSMPGHSAAAAKASLPAWAAAACAADERELALLPLRWAGATRAVVVIASPEPIADNDLQAAKALRDRLAVAFSAREREAEMLHRAVHDSLTGLANRTGLNEFLDRLAATLPAPFAVLFVDLDHFKNANDSLGHEVGDALLCEAAQRLRGCVPDGSLVARQGGDEFVLVLVGPAAAAADVIAAEVVRTLALPFRVGAERHVLGASVGVALAPEHGSSRVELLRHADIAMYAAKTGGRGRFVVFDDSLDAVTHARLRLPSELRRALERGELLAYYQPRVEPFGGAITSVEALVRWQHPERGLLGPSNFIAIAEESQLIEDIGAFMLDDACARMAVWRRRFPTLERVSVNVSPRQLRSGDLPDRVRAILQRHALGADALELEITESMLVDDAERVCEQLAELRRLGVSIALDDFGTGYSSLAMLRRLPIDVMKIDRAFVCDLDPDGGALAVIRTIATLAKSLRLRLVAEGVETRGQAALVGSLGCDEVQGFLYSTPLAPHELERRLEAGGVIPGVGAPAAAAA